MADASQSRPAPGPVLITGCSSGIGRATALHLAGTGRPVIATVLDLADPGDLPALARERGLPIEVLPLDITREDSIRTLIEGITERHGRLGALVNNAGIGVGGFFEDLTDDELRLQMETNFFGTARMTRHAIPLLRASAPSHLVTLSSLAGRLGVPGLSVYHASKHALEGLFDSLYYELRPMGIRVVLVEPGMIRTSLLDRGFHLSPRLEDRASTYFERGQRLLADLKDRFENKSSPPEVVARIIGRILDQDAPRLRYAVGPDAKVILLLKKLMPEPLFVRFWRSLNG